MIYVKVVFCIRVQGIVKGQCHLRVTCHLKFLKVFISLCLVKSKLYLNKYFPLDKLFAVTYLQIESLLCQDDI
jgi:hypothetical protein